MARFRFAPFLLVALLMIGAAAPTKAETVNDPFESVNRKIFDFNLALDRTFLRPVARFYVENVPDAIREIVHSVLTYLRTPIILANDLLQGEIDRAGQTVARAVVNTVIGIGGTVDAASKMGIEFHDEDFGQTLAVWGFGEGPYLVLPLLGPSNPRDAIGLGADSFADPVNFYVDDLSISLPRSGAGAIDTRARNLDTLEDLERTSLDFYAAVRSLYRQRRNDEIKNGENEEPVPIPAISLEGEGNEAGATESGELAPALSFDVEKEQPNAAPRPGELAPAMTLEKGQQKEPEVHSGGKTGPSVLLESGGERPVAAATATPRANDAEAEGASAAGAGNVSTGRLVPSQS